VGADDCDVPELPLIRPGIRAQSAAVRVIAGEQAAIVARAQLLAAGVSRGKISRALHSGSLHRIHGGIYAAVAPELLTEEGRLVAALLAAGEGALLSHGTVAWRWRIIPAPPSLITLATPRRRVVVPGLEIFGSARLRPGDSTHNGRFPPPPCPARSWTSPRAMTAARCCARWRRPSSSTTCVPPTSRARCAAGTRAAPTFAPP
jgi:hypothetical protein